MVPPILLNNIIIKILEETEEARQHLRELLVRQNELAKLERSITEVRDMFLRISTLIMEQVCATKLRICRLIDANKYSFVTQSALVQVVEYHAQQASVRMDKGTEELEKARDHKIKSIKVLFLFIFS